MTMETPALMKTCLMLSLAVVSVRAQLPKPSAAEILVGPNVLVSREEGDTAHAETMIVANPNDVKNLLGASILFTRSEWGMTCKTYASKDGGYTWLDTAFPERFEYMSFDPQVAFGTQGTAYFIMLSVGNRNVTYLYRSEDNGFTWERPRLLKKSDHPQMIVDKTTGKYAGRVYVTAMHGIKSLGVTRSENDGRSFIGPTVVPNPRNYAMLNQNPLVFNDGTLFIPYFIWDENGAPGSSITNRAEFVTSSDGGISFSEPNIVFSVPRGKWSPRTDLRGSFATGSNLVYALDTRPNIGDRLYVLWHEPRLDHQRLLFSSSVDKGKTWSEAKLVSSNVPTESAQYQPMLAVNSEGVIGIAWFDTRNAKEQNRYDLYFTASIDGGQSFLEPRRVSSRSSLPAGAGNLTPYKGYGSATKNLTDQLFRTELERYANGGDYMGFTADVQGMFHPFWIDSRSGTAQIWTAGIQVIKSDSKSASMAYSPPITVKASVNDKLTLVTDPPIYDAARQEAIIPIRLKNISADTIYGPVTVEVKKLAEWTILNAGNGKDGVGAVFDYSSALGDWHALTPGAFTEAVEWRFKYSGVGSTPSIGIEVKASLAETK